MPSSVPSTGPLKRDNVVCVQKANRDKLISSFVKEQRTYAEVRAYQGRAESVSWDSKANAQSNGRPPPSTIIGFGTPILKPRRSKKEGQSAHASLRVVKSKCTPLQHVKVSN